MNEDFLRCKMEYAKDALGKEILLKDGKFQVMMEWEKPYMHACIDALKPFGDVLEIGFGLGYSASHIQTYHPKSHTIIEYHPVVAAHAREWAKQHPHVRIIQDTWQNALPKLGVFDCIFFDDYPLHTEQEIENMQKESEASDLLLKKGQKLLQHVHQQFPFLHEIKYSDTDLLELKNQMEFQNNKEVQHFIHFLLELAAREQITQQQLQKILIKLSEEKIIANQEIENLVGEFSKQTLKPRQKPKERLMTFLQACLKQHMRKGSRFSCFLSSASSKFEDEQFFNEIIVNPNLHFYEEQIFIEVPENCNYFCGNKALVITIERIS